MPPLRFAAVLAALTLIPGALQAQTITACYVPKSGSIYRIKAAGAPEACKTSHIEFSWDASGATTTATISFTLPAGMSGVATAPCPAGSMAVGGGWFAGGSGFDLSMSRKHPQTAGWMVGGHNHGSIPVTVWVEAYCRPA